MTLFWQALSLFIDGTETSSTALSYALYELAKNPNCQEKLYNQMLEAKSKHDGIILLGTQNTIPTPMNSSQNDSLKKSNEIDIREYF